MQTRTMSLTAVSTEADTRRYTTAAAHAVLGLWARAGCARSCDMASRWTGIPEDFQIAGWRSHDHGDAASSGHPVICCEFTGGMS
ncbi:hypothetical protein AOQ84DRAFT_355481 [Glonium stellatum]|uniref:Uncharacterized protein n=1 Tax=Glonium stellatum TaxID=574774 RepID=A0A8E2JR66_9PEZI|nr:hypothetical protein AOQ84DRAFT_355481 [Glonium stellatum]